jgi:hypothetical protein
VDADEQHAAPQCPAAQEGTEHCSAVVKNKGGRFGGSFFTKKKPDSGGSDDSPATSGASAGPEVVEAPNTLQDPREATHSAPKAQASQRELEMQELPSERDRAGVRFSAGHENYSRLRKLHVELERVVQRQEHERASVQRWQAWLWEFCTLGNALQAVCSVTMILSLSQPLTAPHSVSNLVTALILCGSLMLLLWVQNASLQRESMRLGSRASRFLSRLEWYVNNPLEASTFGDSVAGGANVWLQTTRPISTVQVSADTGGCVSLPTQLLVSGDRITGPNSEKSSK